MNFDLSEEQEAVRDLAEQIFSGSVDVERVKEIEASEDRIDRALWRELADANLLGIAIPEANGGLGLGFLDLCLVLREAGKHVVPMPLLSCLVTAALPCARFGTDEQRAYLAPVVRGEFIGTAALIEYGSDADDPHVVATPDGDGWRLDGVKTTVPFADIAGAIAQLWRGRADRYSETRTVESSGLARGGKKVEMSYIGG